MDLLLLLLAVPLLWLLLLPARLLRRLGKQPMIGPIVLAGLLVAGWAIFATGDGDTRRVSYAEGDTQLRAMLE